MTLQSVYSQLRGQTTATFYVVDPITRLPLEPVPDIVPGLSINRVTADVVLSETMTYSSTITKEPIEDSSEISVHQYIENDQLSMSLLFVAGGPTPPIGAMPWGARLDLLRIELLVRIFKNKLPVMVVTPNQTVPFGLIRGFSPTRTNIDGVQMTSPFQIEPLDIRGPLQVAAEPDLAAQAASNSQSLDVGGQSTVPLDLNATGGTVITNAPTIGF